MEDTFTAVSLCAALATSILKASPPSRASAPASLASDSIKARIALSCAMRDESMPSTPASSHARRRRMKVGAFCSKTPRGCDSGTTPHACHVRPSGHSHSAMSSMESHASCFHASPHPIRGSGTTSSVARFPPPTVATSATRSAQRRSSNACAKKSPHPPPPSAPSSSLSSALAAIASARRSK